jgi:hypothetical protein
MILIRIYLSQIYNVHLYVCPSLRKVCFLDCMHIWRGELCHRFIIKFSCKCQGKLAFNYGNFSFIISFTLNNINCRFHKDSELSLTDLLVIPTLIIGDFPTNTFI